MKEAASLRALVSITAALILSIGVVGTAQAAVPPVEAFGSLPAETDAVLSPDGHWLAWVDHREAKPRVVMFDVQARKPQRILAVPESTKVRSLTWNDSSTLLITVSGTVEAKVATERSREYFLTTAYDPAGGDGRMLPTANGRARGALAALHANLISTRTAKPHTVIMATNECHNGASCLVEVDTTTGNSQIIKTGSMFTAGWVVDRDGKPVAREDWDYLKRAYRVYALSGDGVKEILRKDDNERPAIVGLLPDNSALVMLASNGRPHQAAWALPMDGSSPRLLADDPDADIEATSTDPYTGAIIGVYLSGSKNAVHWLDPAAQHRFDVVQRAFPNKGVDIYGWTEDGSKTLARVASATSAPLYYLIDFNTHRADIAAEEYPALANVKLGDVKEISYKARDGTPIPAYLTTPADKPAGPTPLVVLPHGGPQARDYPDFDWIAQFLASRGYAVLQPQFRGSTGFGDAFRKAGYRQWGGLMQDDVTDGVHAMIEQGVADPHRICIVGLSYGGYAALAGAAFTPKLYACAASISGISDLPALLREEAPEVLTYNRGRLISTAQADLSERIGAPTDSSLATHSPINAVAAITIPILIVYGTGDGVVPNEQSTRMAQALSAAGKPVSVAKLPDEDHWLSRSETRIQMLTEVDNFLKQHL